MDHLSQPGTASAQRFPPRPESVARARRFLRDALAGSDPEVVASAELLVSELVTNAVLHARTETEVSAWPHGDAVRVLVRDGRPGRALVPQGDLPHVGPGQGLAVVERLAARYGVVTEADHKTVWCELRAGGDGTTAAPSPPAPSPSGWENTGSVSRPTRTVTLIDLPGSLCLASQQHRHTLLREMVLAASAGDLLGVSPQDLAAAHDANNVISAGVTAALEEQRTAGQPHSLSLSLPADIAPAVSALCRVLDAAEEAARDERLLTCPALPQNRALRQWLLGQVIGQLGGEAPTAWTVVPRETGASPSELAPWDVSHVWASRVPTVAADDENRIIAANGPAAAMLGWQADELVGQRLTTLIPEHLRARHLAAFSSLLLTGRSRILGRSVPLPALHRDGRQVPVRLFIQTQGTTDGRTVFVAQLSPRTAPSAPPPPPGAAEDRQPVPQTPSAPPEPSGPPPETEHLARVSGERAGGSAVERRLSLLADIGEAMSSTPSLDEGLQHVCRLLTRQLADWSVVDLLVEPDQLERVCVTHRDPRTLAAEARAGRLPPMSGAARGPLARVLRGAGPLLLTGAPSPGEAGSPLDSGYVDLFARMGASSAIVAPLRARGTVFGALTVARTGARKPFGEEELSLVDGVTRNLALGVERARLFQETRHIAERLQRSLLPVLPRIPHLRMAARYAPSSTTAQVGGDWYDCFTVPGGQTALVIGDVTGHDIEAAVAMSQLRSMLRGIAIDRQEPPGEVLRRLDVANHTLYQEATATCIYALVTGPANGPWELKHSSAGHLPPLLTTSEGHTRYLDEGSGLLLGMEPDMPRPAATDALPAHSTVLLYTDGLIERRDESLDRAMERLRDHAAALAHEPLDVFCDELLIGLGADSTDDIAVLAVRPVPSH
ncbi:SpoIIE family protein phosphatase [Streptomyces albus subsp. chlorinus]|uniref:SpoIIE family protein phosphatase n=2 Tax=Streptomyces albus TaxID=1888 RepID=UPI003D0A84B1